MNVSSCILITVANVCPCSSILMLVRLVLWFSTVKGVCAAVDKYGVLCQSSVIGTVGTDFSNFLS